MLDTTSDLATDVVQGSAYWSLLFSGIKNSLEDESSGSMTPRSDVEDSLAGLLIENSFTSDPMVLLLEDIRTILYT